MQYECAIWSLTLQEEERLKVFENWVLGRAFGPRRKDVPTHWRKLHKEELYTLY
jgi:hypothetical protein